MRALLILLLVVSCTRETVSDACQYSPGCREALLQERISECVQGGRVWTGASCRSKTERELCEDSGGMWSTESTVSPTVDPLTGNIVLDFNSEHVCRN